jgi:hypothetical protein
MQRFYFHVRAGDELTADDEGAEFPNLSAALGEARLAARELLAEAIKSGRLEVPESCVLAGKLGRELGTVARATVMPNPMNR